MSDLRVGMKIFHNGTPLELLYRKDHYQNMEIWRVKLLFVEPEEKDELFEPNDRVSFLHTTPVRGAA